VEGRTSGGIDRVNRANDESVPGARHRQCPAVERSTGNVVPLLHEIRHALERLADTGECTAIDLRSLPLAPGEGDVLESMLGEG